MFDDNKIEKVEACCGFETNSWEKTLYLISEVIGKNKQKFIFITLNEEKIAKIPLEKILSTILIIIFKKIRLK